MSYSDFRTALVQWFAEKWENRVPTIYPNQSVETAGLDVWTRFSIHGATGEQMTGGTSAVHSWTGFVQLQIFCRPFVGTKAAEELAAAAEGIFSRGFETYGTSGGTIVFRTPSIIDVEGDPYMISVVSPIERYEQMTADLT